MSSEPLPGPGDGLAEEAASVVRARTGVVPAVALVLGSGLGPAAEIVEPDAELLFQELPGFPRPTVPGHAGRLVVGHVGGVPVAAFLGRIHFYEGHPMPVSALPIRVARALGARIAVITASVGGLDRSLRPGTLVVGTDHLNMMGENPLRGWRTPEGSPPFVDLSTVYDRELADLAVRCAEDLGLAVTRGIYLAVSGPSYETPAEIEFMRRAGATVVGMSVVPEAVPARALGMRVLGLFSVTNATGGEVSHEEVIQVGREIGPALGRLLARVLPEIADVRDGRAAGELEAEGGPEREGEPEAEAAPAGGMSDGL